MRHSTILSKALLIAGSSLALSAGLPAFAQSAQDSQIRSDAAAITPRPGAPASFADLTAQLQPAVVNISTRQKVKVQAQANPFAGTPFGELFGNQFGGGAQKGTREAQSLGSGFIISPDGYVVTNNHVVSGDGQGVESTVESIAVTMPDGTEYPAKLIGRDKASDLAVLKISSSSPLPYVSFGNSHQARVGDWVLAIGNPFGLGSTVTSGIISAVYRNTGSSTAYDRYLQTDASINRGNSGGPMFDMSGQVIGINSAIISPTGGNVGIGFAIPADVAEPIVNKLKSGQSIERGYLGVRIQGISDDMASSLGIAKNRGEFIQDVEPGGAAAEAGLQPGDVVLKVAGAEVTPEQSLSYLVSNTAPGSKIPLEVLRGGKHMVLSAKVAKRPSEQELAAQNFGQPEEKDESFAQSQGGRSSAKTNKLGVSLAQITPSIARQIGVEASTRGVVVAQVDDSSDAASKGLRRGDVILSINNQPVTSEDQVNSALSQAKATGREAVLLRVKRSGTPPVYLPVRLSDD